MMEAVRVGEFPLFLCRFVEAAIRKVIQITTSLVRKSMTMGHNRPAIVPMPFDIPIRIDAYLGAISK